MMIMILFSYVEFDDLLPMNVTDLFNPKENVMSYILYILNRDGSEIFRSKGRQRREIK